MAYEIYQKVGGQYVPLNLTTDQRLANVEATCLDYTQNGIKKNNVATDTTQGIVELATADETTAGTDATRAVTPAGLKVELLKKVDQSELETAIKELIVEYGGVVPA